VCRARRSTVLGPPHVEATSSRHASAFAELAAWIADEVLRRAALPHLVILFGDRFTPVTE
jgi:hypothetical protein